MLNKVDREKSEVQVIKAKVEMVSPNLGKYWNSPLLEQMSTDPTIVGPNVNRDTLHNTCGNFCEELQGLLVTEGVTTSIKKSGDVPRFDHVHLVTQANIGEIVIDPTIGQFVIGHNHIFVGMRHDLRRLLVEHTSNSNAYQLSKQFVLMTPEEVFLTVWGRAGVPFHSLAVGSISSYYGELKYSMLLVKESDKRFSISLSNNPNRLL